MSAGGTCKECGTVILPDSPGGYCARCLLGLGLETAGEQAVIPTAVSPSGAANAGVKLRCFGDYELREEIARGGMGVVFKARQISLNRLVALKLISSGTLATEDLVKRFKAEAEAAASLSHPNIVPIYEIGEHEGQHYFSMGLIEGPNLREALPQSQSNRSPVFSSQSERNPEHWPFHGSVRLVSTIARAVYYAHQRGVLHRDIKPSNILLDSAGEPHLTDFGLAKLVQKESTLTHTNAVMGTPAYMSPEQARGETKDVTTAVDVYGLGAVLYETLTGSPPFGGSTSMETIRQVLDQEPRRPSIFNGEVDRDLETICLKCLEKDPRQRYASAQALADDLESWLRHEPITARRIGYYERARKWVRRRPAIAALATVSLVSLIALVIGSTAVSLVSLLALAMGSTMAAFRLAAAKKQLRRTLYASEMNTAYQTWHAGDALRTRSLLAMQHPRLGDEDLRGWEWRYLWSRSRPQEFDEWKSPGGAVVSIAYSPDGRSFVTHGRGTIQLWDAASRRPIAKLGDEHGWGDSVAFSSDGSLLLTTYRETRQIRVWDVRKQQLLGTFTNHIFWVACAAFLPNGRAIVSTGGMLYPDMTEPLGELKLWDASTFQEIADFEQVDFAMWQCNVSPNGRWVAGSGMGPTVQIWDVDSRKPIARLTGHEGRVFALRFSPDGRTLATGDFRGTVRLWDLQTREAVVVGSHGHPVYCLAFSPDGKRLASASRDHTVKLWDVANPGEPATLRGHATRVWCVAFSPDGKTVATGGHDGAVKFWNANSLSDDNVLAQTHGEGPIGYSPDGRFLVWQDCGLKAVTIWDVAGAKVGERIAGSDFAFSPTGNLLAVVSPTGRLQLWNLNAFAEVSIPHEVTIQLGDGPALAYSPRGDRLAAVNLRGDIVLRDVKEWEEQTRIEAGLRDGWVLFAPNGKSLLSGARKEEVTAWSIATREPVGTFRGHESEVRAAAISPDGRLLATGSEDTTVRLWNLATRREVAKFVGGAGAIYSLAFSRDGKTIAAGSFEGLIQLWNIAFGQQVGTLQGHTTFVSSLTFSPDGNVLASTGMDNTVRLWKAATWEEIGRVASARR